MKKICLVFLIILCLVGSAYAHPVVDQVQDNQEVLSPEIDNKVNPDEIVFWYLELIIDKIDEELTFDDIIRAEKVVMHVKERKEELELMLKINNAEGAVRAKQSLVDGLNSVGEVIEELNSENPEEEIGEILEIEKALEEFVLDERFKDILSEVENLKIKIENKKDKTRIKLKAVLNIDEEVVDELEERLSLEKGIKFNKKEEEVKLKIKEDVKVEEEVVEETTKDKEKDNDKEDEYVEEEPTPEEVVEEITKDKEKKDKSNSKSSSKQSSKSSSSSKSSNGNSKSKNK